MARVDTVYAMNDSVRFSLSLRTEHLMPGASETLTFAPVLTDGRHNVCLPPVVVNGHRRAPYDRRERALDYLHKYHAEPYCILRCDASGKLPVEERNLNYTYCLPYAAWMNHAALRLEISGKECCEAYPLGSVELTADLDLDDAWRIRIVERWKTDTLYIYRNPAGNTQTHVAGIAVAPAAGIAEATPPASAFTGRPRGNVYRIGFRHNDSQIDRTLFCNAETLAEMDSAITAGGGKTTVLRITACSSPDGTYASNKYVARNRADSVVRYLKEKHPETGHLLPAPQCNIENWDGLERMLQDGNYPWRKQALDIIRRGPVNQYREKRLMDLQGGNPYREMYNALFPLLRYADVELEYGTKEKEAER